MSHLTWVLLITFCCVVVLYYIFLRRRADWADTPFPRRIELYLSPLPILVGLIEAMVGYQASKQATTVMERTLGSDYAAEVRRTAEKAIELYGDFLITIDLAYSEALLVELNTEGYFEALVEEYSARLKAGSDKQSAYDIDKYILERLRLNQQNLASRLEEVESALHRIALNPFANACYRRQWEAKKGDLRTLALERRHDVPRQAVGDFIRAATIFRIGAEHRRTAIRNIDLSSESYSINELISKRKEVDRRTEFGLDDATRRNLARFIENKQKTVKERATAIAFLVGPHTNTIHAFFLAKDETRKTLPKTIVKETDAYRRFLFLGNLVALFPVEKATLLYGAAALADFLNTLPNRDDLKVCLQKYYETEDEGLRSASKRYAPFLAPEEITPSLFRSLRLLEKTQFGYETGSGERKR